MITNATSSRTLRDAAPSRGEGLLDAFAEARAVDRLVPVRLHRADLVQRLVDVRADVADAILARPGEAPHASAEQDDRRDHQRDAARAPAA